MYKSFEEEKGSRDQILELKMKEILNIDQKFTQALESEIIVLIKKRNFWKTTQKYLKKIGSQRRRE